MITVVVLAPAETIVLPDTARLLAMEEPLPVIRREEKVSWDKV